MRWNGLFADLEAQLARELQAETDALAADELRLERGRRTLVDRLVDMAAAGPEVRLRCRDGVSVAMHLDAVGEGWVAGREIASGRYRVQSLAGIVGAVAASGAAGASAATDGVTARLPSVTRTTLPLRVVLRDLSRRRAAVTVATGWGEEHGTIDSVGADHLELAVHPRGTLRRRAEVRAIELIALHAIDAVVQE